MELKEILNPYYNSIKKGIETENWISTVMAALTLPDICTSIEGKRHRTDYVEWFDTYVTIYSPKIHYSKSLAAANTVDEYYKAISNPSNSKLSDIEEKQLFYFTGLNAYALRCTLLHNGNGEVGTQRIYKDQEDKSVLLGIEKVKFTTSNHNLIISQFDDTVMINPKPFCEALLEGIEKWIDEKKNKIKVLENAKRLQIFE